MKTERTFTDIETGYKFMQWQNPETHQIKLLAEGQPDKIPNRAQPSNFYASNFPQDIKLNTGKIIALKPQTFYSIKKGEIVTHRKIEGLHKKFVRI